MRMMDSLFAGRCGSDANAALVGTIDVCRRSLRSLFGGAETKPILTPRIRTDSLDALFVLHRDTTTAETNAATLVCSFAR